jgi:opacity protein-like surface antigen
MTLASRAVFLLTVSVLPLATVAFAADYEPPIYVEPAEEYVPVEVGSGWYLRGDIGYNFDKSFKDTELFVDPVLSFGPFDLIEFDEKETPAFGSVGFGYHFNDYLRADLNIGLLPSSKFNMGAIVPSGCGGTLTTTSTSYDADGNPIDPAVITVGPAATDCAASLKIKNTYWTGLANGYIDLGTYAGLTPYVGGGVGVIHSKVSLKGSAVCSAWDETTSDGTTTTRNTFLCNGQNSPDDPDVEYVAVDYKDRDWNFMYALNAGVSYQIAQNTSIDVGYQYVNAPDAPFIRATSNGVEFGEGLDFHQVRVGLRYDLW